MWNSNLVTFSRSCFFPRIRIRTGAQTDSPEAVPLRAPSVGKICGFDSFSLCVNWSERLSIGHVFLDGYRGRGHRHRGVDRGRGTQFHSHRGVVVVVAVVAGYAHGAVVFLPQAVPSARHKVPQEAGHEHPDRRAHKGDDRPDLVLAPDRVVGVLLPVSPVVKDPRVAIDLVRKDHQGVDAHADRGQR